MLVQGALAGHCVGDPTKASSIWCIGILGRSHSCDVYHGE